MTFDEYHKPTLDEIEERENELEDAAEDERYIDRSMGYGFVDYLDDVERTFKTDGKNWDLGSDVEAPSIKAIQKIFRRVCREMRAG